MKRLIVLFFVAGTVFTLGAVLVRDQGWYLEYALAYVAGVFDCLGVITSLALWSAKSNREV